MQDSPDRTIKQVLCEDFSRISPALAEEVCKLAKVSHKLKGSDLSGEHAEALHKALGEVKVMAPPASCVVPIGEELLVTGLRRRFPNAEFFVSTTRPPSVYRGNPFVVEVGLAYGGDMPTDEQADVMRFANRVPLQYQPKACAISESVYDTNWKSYELAQPKGSLPVGPLAIVVHLASVWVPFTSEAKEAVAHYDDLLREMRLAVQECGRKLGSYLRARMRDQAETKRLGIFQRYIPEVSNALAEILKIEKGDVEKLFYATLPSFVKTKVAEAADESQPAGKPSMLPPPNSDSTPPQAAKGKAAPKTVEKAESKKAEPKKVEPKTLKKKAEVKKPAPAAPKKPAPKTTAKVAKAPAKKGKK
jgi:DNA topoisomerase VI subunit B